VPEYSSICVISAVSCAKYICFWHDGLRHVFVRHRIGVSHHWHCRARHTGRRAKQPAADDRAATRWCGLVCELGSFGVWVIGGNLHGLFERTCPSAMNGQTRLRVFVGSGSQCKLLMSGVSAKTIENLRNSINIRPDKKTNLHIQMQRTLRFDEKIL
jgi:hypothetical protein